jgi:fermentation-respiration switch protein FrsA (DUF1100 family)
MTNPEILRTLAYVVLGTVALYAVVGLLLSIFQERLIYFPERQLIATPMDAALQYEDVHLTTSDGVLLHGWYVPADNQQAVLLYFHGNGGNISHRIEALLQFHRIGLSTLIIDYRGYGRSEGEPGESGTYKDAEAAWRYLVVDRKINPGTIVLLGRSLGGAVAAYLASRESPRALILESTFTSIPDRGAELYPYFPVRLLSRFRYDTLNRMKEIRSPLLIVHSPEDEIVPFSHGQHLFQAANEPKEFLRIGGGHNDGFVVSAAQYERGLRDFLSRY